MFSIKNWLKNAFVDGYKNGTFTAEYIADRCEQLISKNTFTNAEAEEIYTAIEEYDESQAQAQAETAVEIPAETESEGE